MAKTKKPKACAEGKVPALRVRTAAGTFRRAGIDFTAVPQTLLYSDLSDEQVDAIMAEPRLFAQDVEVDAAPAADAAQAGQ